MQNVPPPPGAEKIAALTEGEYPVKGDLLGSRGLTAGGLVGFGRVYFYYKYNVHLFVFGSCHGGRSLESGAYSGFQRPNMIYMVVRVVL